jgi:hypothetical protein
MRKDKMEVQMYISLKYVIFYTCVGGVVGYFSDGEKKVGIAGAVLSALMGASFGVGYAVLSAIEFGVGFYLGSALQDKNENEE